MSSGKPLPDSIQEALVSVGSLAANGSFDETVARFVRQKVFPKVKFVREGDFACKGEGSTLFKYIKEGLRVEKSCPWLRRELGSLAYLSFLLDFC
jgi:hypothetical protein